MEKRKIITKLCFIVLACSLLSACNAAKTDNDISGTEVQTEQQTLTEGGQNADESIYKETECYFVLKDLNKADKTLVDGNTLSRKGTVVDKTIVMIDSIDIYNAQKSKVGYTKENIECYYECDMGEWSFIIFDEGGFFVLTEELLTLSEVPEKDNVIVENDEIIEDNSSKEEPTYSVADMNKTMYVKQSVNLRSGPSSDYDKIGSLTTNQEVVVTGQADTGWYRIDYNDGVAFVSNNYLSDVKVEVNNTPSDDDSGEYIPPTNDDAIYVPIEPEPTPTPEEPTYTYTVDEVIAIVKSTLESNGIICSTDYASAEDIAEFGPDLGMGWGIVDISMTDPYTDAQLLLDGYLWDKNNLYYLEYQGVENGEVVLKTYWGTQY